MHAFAFFFFFTVKTLFRERLLENVNCVERRNIATFVALVFQYEI